MVVDSIELEPGDLLIEKANGAWGLLVRAVFGKDYQHVRVVTFSGKTIEAVWDGVKLTKAPSSLARYEVWRPRCDRTVKTVALGFMWQQLDQVYGYASVALMTVRRKLGLPVPDAPGVYCSELVARGYTKAGYDLNKSVRDDDTAPWDLRDPSRSDCLKA